VEASSVGISVVVEFVLMNDKPICIVCGTAFTGVENRGICSSCKSRPRVRTISTLVQNHLIPLLSVSRHKASCEALCFAMTRHERTLLSSLVTDFTSVSLFGTYSRNHTTGIDARDLSSYQSRSFDLVYSALLFDYFPDHEIALGEAYRVLKYGGIFATHIQGPWLSDDRSAPRIIKTIEPAPGYYEYIPKGKGMYRISVGRQWFLEAMEKVGFRAQLLKLCDTTSGVVCDWFVGVKPAKANGITLATAAVSEVLPIREYSVPLPPKVFGADLVEIRISIPKIKDKGARFAEHVMRDGKATEEVVATSVGGYWHSENLGLSFNWIPVRDYEQIRFINAFSLPNGNRLLQSRGAGPQDAVKGAECPHIVVTLDQHQNVLAARSFEAKWHGTSSVDCAQGTVMFADYQHNQHPSKTNLALRRDSCVFRSKDFGLSWEKVFEQPGTSVRHFHGVRADSYVTGRWYLFSGDQECEVGFWISENNGDTWQRARFPDNLKRSAFRLTDLIITEKHLLWGSDDLLGLPADLDSRLPYSRRSGSRLFLADKFDLCNTIDLGYIGQPVRNVVDLGTAVIVLTQGKIYPYSTRPAVFLLPKHGDSFGTPMHLFDVDNYANATTGFTYSSASRAACDSIFFTYRGPNDAFRSAQKIMRWEVMFR
jgi:SAM-dependent methyltransferase